MIIRKIARIWNYYSTIDYKARKVLSKLKGVIKDYNESANRSSRVDFFQSTGKNYPSRIQMVWKSNQT